MDNIAYCGINFNCGAFLCELILSFSDGGMDARKNPEYTGENGMQRFLKRERAKRTCPGCGKKLSWYLTTCPDCGQKPAHTGR